MNERISDYVSSSMKEAKAAIKNSDVGFLKYLLFTVTSVIGKLFFFSFPLFALADYEIVNLIRTKKPVSIEAAFADSKSMPKYWKTMLYTLMVQLSLIATALVFIGLMFGLSYLGKIFDESAGFARYYTVFFVQLGCVILLIVSVIQIALYFAPTLYLIQSHPDMELTEALNQSVKLLSRNGKKQLLIAFFQHFIRFIVLTAISTLVVYFVYNVFVRTFFVIVTIPLAILVLLSIPRLLLSYRITTTKIYDKLLEEATYANLFETEQIAPLSSNIRKEELLTALFDEIIVDEPEAKVEKVIINEVQ